MRYKQSYDSIIGEEHNSNCKSTWVSEKTKKNERPIYQFNSNMKMKGKKSQYEATWLKKKIKVMGEFSKAIYQIILHHSLKCSLVCVLR